jgi:hypothetical protein
MTEFDSIGDSELYGDLIGLQPVESECPFVNYFNGSRFQLIAPVGYHKDIEVYIDVKKTGDAGGVITELEFASSIIENEISETIDILLETPG